MKTEKVLKMGSAICTGLGVTITAVGMVVHPVLPLGIVMIIKANAITAGVLSVTATIVENREDIKENMHNAYNNINEGLHNAEDNVHDAVESIHSYFNHPLQEDVSVNSNSVIEFAGEIDNSEA